jgi:hypothetical protein
MNPVTVAFLTNQLGFRGTETNLWLLAHYNEVYLGNKSIIFVRQKTADVNAPDQGLEATKYFTQRFATFFVEDDEIDSCLRQHQVEVCLIEGAGWPGAQIVPQSVPTIMHCVFEAAHPLGATVHTAISRFVAANTTSEILPNIVEVAEFQGDLRQELNIPKSCEVFGRHGGHDSFDIPFVRETVNRFAAENPNTYFVFLNTQQFGDPKKNIIFLPPTRDKMRLRAFINTCNAMVHARERGETFGLAVAEFATCGKPVLTYGLSPETEHLALLGASANIYNDPNQLLALMHGELRKGPTGYQAYKPANVIEIFKRLLGVAISKYRQR